MYIGIDIGGTKIAIGYYDAKHLKLVRCETYPSDPHGDPDVWYARLKNRIDTMIMHRRMSFPGKGRIGVGIPGQILPDGNIGHCPNTPVLTKFNLIASLKRDYRVPIFADNDANVAALAEYQYGAGKGLARMVYVTISTGIGGGIVEHGKLTTGLFHNAGELGHMVLQIGGERCGCGRLGCFEAYGRGPALENRVRTRLRQKNLNTDEKKLLALAGGKASAWTNQLLGAALKQKNAVAVQELDRHAKYLGEGLGSIANLLDPDAIIIGGGLTQLGTPLFKAIQKHMRVRCLSATPLKLAKLKTDIGVWGALALCQQK